MFYLNYDDVLKKFSDFGYLPLLDQIKGKEILLSVDANSLKKIGLMADTNILIIAYENNNFEFYEIAYEQNIGSGEESVIHRGKNLKTQKTIATKGAWHSPTLSSNSMTGWKIAREKLESYPYFVKTYALGQVCELPDNPEDYHINCRSSAYQIMEEIISPEQSCNLGSRAKNWNKRQIKQFMTHITNAFEAFSNEGIHLFDSNCGNILIDQNNLPKLCDFSELRMSKDDRNYEGHYYLAVRFFYSLYYKVTHCYGYRPFATDVCEASDSYLEKLSNWIMQKKISSRAVINFKIDEAIDFFEQQKCIIQCLEKTFSSNGFEDSDFCHQSCRIEDQEVLLQGEVLDETQVQTHMRRLLSFQENPQTSAGTRFKPASLEIAILLKKTRSTIIFEMTQIARDITPMIIPMISWQNALAISYGLREVLGQKLLHPALRIFFRNNPKRLQSFKKEINKISQKDKVKLTCDLAEFAIRSNVPRSTQLLELAAHEVSSIARKPKRKFTDIVRFTLLFIERMGNSFIHSSSLSDIVHKGYVVYRNSYAENGYNKIKAFFSGINAAFDNTIRLIPGARIIADKLDERDENASLFDGPLCSVHDLEERSQLLSALNESIKRLCDIEKATQRYSVNSRNKVIKARNLLYMQKEDLRAMKQKHMETRLAEAQAYDFDMATINVAPLSTDKSNKYSCVIQ